MKDLYYEKNCCNSIKNIADTERNKAENAP